MTIIRDCFSRIIVIYLKIWPELARTCNLSTVQNQLLRVPIYAGWLFGQVLGTVFGNFGGNLVNFLGNLGKFTGDEDGTVKLWDKRQSSNMTKVCLF